MLADPACPRCGDPGYEVVPGYRLCGNSGCPNTDDLPEVADPFTANLAKEAAEAIRFADIPRLERLIVELEERYGLAPADSSKGRP